MSTLQSILRYINEDFAPPTVRLVLVSQNEILLNKIVSKKSTLHDILKEEGIKEEKNYLLFGKPVNLDQKIIELIPKDYSNLSNIELIIEDKNILLEEEQIYYEKILKPFDNPFKVLIFTPNEFNVSIKSYPEETIEKFKLNKFSINASSYCNSPDDLYISGGSGEDYSSLNSGNKHFWKINSIKTNIEKLNDLPIDKQNHSMIYIPKRYIYFIGGNNKSTFFYDIFFSTFHSWANTNKLIKKPCLILVNNIYIYSFGTPDINNNENNFTFERTNLKSKNPKWELKEVKNQILPIRNFGGIKIADEIYFLGGRNNRGEKMFKFNTTSENLEICKQENTKLKPLDKNFYDLNEFNSAMIPDCDLGKNIQIIIFNKKRKKYRKVLYEKNLEEIVNNDNLKRSNLDKSLIKENEQMKIVWKEFKNNYVDKNILEDNMILLPSVEDLKEGNIVFKNNKVENEEVKEDKNENDYEKENNEGNMINNNIYGDENNIENINIKDDLNNNIEKESNDDLRKKNEENNNILDNQDKAIDENNPNNKINEKGEENNNILLEEKLISFPNSISLKQIFDQDINNKIDLKTKFVDYQSSKPEDIPESKKINENIKDKEEINNDKDKKKENMNESPTLYRKKTIIKQDKKNTIVIQCESNEKSENKETNKIKNKNINDEKLKDNNTFNIEYNNEIIVPDKKLATLSDMISNTSEINKNKENKGLNSRIIVNVPKSKTEDENANNKINEINIDKIPIE